MEQLNRSAHPRGRDDVVFRQLDEEWVLFDPVTDRLHALNLTAALVWTHLTGELGVPEIADAVGKSFTPPVEGERVVADVEATIERFRGEGLLA
ncbi:MAG: PqqD family peptide modification chaperone [Gemmatimonadales bacterium]|nr:PqqD family peptide modification chaperone [Gemmatimonadales bacterium]NIN10927.1 PqqD family peptide modification chaperone [Gemmatimonadales bacterium]NIN49525.1 PqqD family peptide modification chaperone [Gemmatimonadales bacterium]NIP06989.1 PqqD family peptide modification chaperone [Gemmatimonadales bacterium]NIQ99048.1 PqqD family peptide modification chaperone [Gemmatimonadales bacterium]